MAIAELSPVMPRFALVRLSKFLLAGKAIRAIH
jgi:hypothetical protein